ncbi:hypothetical protein BDY24DRAFT_382936 [Mrakia frigida]|uniref:uncharacterized protein n=1 Tax=Mrakia frigida TaxID=29902 RepID=UPI003FCC0C04
MDKGKERSSSHFDQERPPPPSLSFAAMTTAYRLSCPPFRISTTLSHPSTSKLPKPPSDSYEELASPSTLEGQAQLLVLPPSPIFFLRPTPPPPPPPLLMHCLSTPSIKYELTVSSKELSSPLLNLPLSSSSPSSLPSRFHLLRFSSRRDFDDNLIPRDTGKLLQNQNLSTPAQLGLRRTKASLNSNPLDVLAFLLAFKGSNQVE